MRSCLLTLAFMLLSPAVFAIGGGGDHVGNGGDACENRFSTIRADIATWIINGGSKGLKFPDDINVPEYNQIMLKQMTNAKISCSDEILRVDGAEKTCKNYVQKNNVPVIVCNADRFMQSKAEDQYMLVHHEYAGLSGFEVNSGAASNYDLSNQISLYLENQIVKKLAVLPADDFSKSTCVGPQMVAGDASNLIPPGLTSNTDLTLAVATFDVRTRERVCVSKGTCDEWKVTPNRLGQGIRRNLQDRGSILLNFDRPLGVGLNFMMQNPEERMWLSMECSPVPVFKGTCQIRTHISSEVLQARGSLTAHCAWLTLRQTEPLRQGPGRLEREVLFTSRF